MEKLKRVDFETALRRKASDFIIKGKSVNELTCEDEKMITRLKVLKQGGAMSFIRINELIHSCLDDLEYIIFWEDVEIFLVEN